MAVRLRQTHNSLGPTATLPRVSFLFHFSAIIFIVIIYLSGSFRITVMRMTNEPVGYIIFTLVHELIYLFQLTSF